MRILLSPYGRDVGHWRTQQKEDIVGKIVGFSLWCKIVFSAIVLHTALQCYQCHFCCFSNLDWILLH